MREPSSTSIEIVRQDMPKVARDLAQVVRLLEIRAFKDAQRVLLRASGRLDYLAGRLEGE